MPGWAGPSLGALVQVGALAAAAVLALTSTGDAVVVAVAVGIGAGRAVPGLVAATAALATTARWGSPDLADLAGTQAVLGPAGLVGPRAAAAGSWLVAVAVVAAWPGPAGEARSALAWPSGAGEARSVGAWPGRLVRWPADLVGALAVGAFVAALVWGPGAGGAWPGRLAATAVATVLALVVASVRPLAGRLAALAWSVPVVLAVTGLALAVTSRPGPPGGPDGLAVPVGAVALALAAAVLAVAGATAAARHPGRPAPAWRRYAGHPALALALLALAARVAELEPDVATPSPPSGGLAAAGSLLALGALVGVATGPRWGVVAGAPGLVAAAHALLAAPAGAPVGAVAVLAGSVAIVAVGGVVVAQAPAAGLPGPARSAGSPAPVARVAGSARPLRAPDGRDEPAPDRARSTVRWVAGAVGAAGVLAVSAAWRWVDVDGLGPWERGVSSGVAVALVAGVVVGLVATRTRGAGRHVPRYAAAVPPVGDGRPPHTIEPVQPSATAGRSRHPFP